MLAREAMTLKNINEEIGVIKAHLEQDQPDTEFILRHAETLLVMAHELSLDRTSSSTWQRSETFNRKRC
jgi:hypothetical protein